MTTLRTAAKQALEALELGYDSAKAEADQYHAAMAGYRQQRHDQMDADVQQIASAITALRAALADPVQEPVAWMVYTLDGKSVCVTDNPADFTAEHSVLPLYTAPPQRKPLSEDEMRKCAGAMDAEPLAEGWRELIKFARAIERAHGITS